MEPPIFRDFGCRRLLPFRVLVEHMKLYKFPYTIRNFKNKCV